MVVELVVQGLLHGLAGGRHAAVERMVLPGGALGRVEVEALVPARLALPNQLGLVLGVVGRADV